MDMLFGQKDTLFPIQCSSNSKHIARLHCVGLDLHVTYDNCQYFLAATQEPAQRTAVNAPRLSPQLRRKQICKVLWQQQFSFLMLLTLPVRHEGKIEINVFGGLRSPAKQKIQKSSKEKNGANLLKTLPQAGQAGSDINKENPLRPKEI